MAESKKRKRLIDEQYRLMLNAIDADGCMICEGSEYVLTEECSDSDQSSVVPSIICDAIDSYIHQSIYNSFSDMNLSDSDMSICEVTCDDNKNTYLQDQLQHWAVSKGITHSALRDLLAILKPHHPEIPSDPRTLLQLRTAEGIVALEEGGFYYHFGLREAIVKWFSNTDYFKPILHLQFNIDGLPIYRSRRLQLWPILSMVIDNELLTKPFMVGLYLGLSKPHVNFLNTFAEELKMLLKDGISIGAIFF